MLSGQVPARVVSAGADGRVDAAVSSDPELEHPARTAAQTVAAAAAAARREWRIRDGG